MNRGHNYLLEAAYRNMARAEWKKELFIAACCVVAIIVFWR